MLSHIILKISDIKNVIRYILHYAVDHTILLPCRIPGYKRNDVLLLPSSTTKREVWQLYNCSASAGADTKAVGFSLLSIFGTREQLDTVIIDQLCVLCQSDSLTKKNRTWNSERKCKCRHRKFSKVIVCEIYLPTKFKLFSMGLILQKTLHNTQNIYYFKPVQRVFHHIIVCFLEELMHIQVAGME